MEPDLEPGPEPAIRVFVVDDAPHLRAMVRTIVDATPGFEFAGEADDGREALMLVREAKPDLVLMDVEMPDVDGSTATRMICGQVPEARVIAWTSHEEPRLVTEMIAAGAYGYLLKGSSTNEFVNSLRWAARGQSVLSRDLTSAVLGELSRLYRDAEQRAQDLHDSYLNTVSSLATALETKDDQTGDHARRVRDYAVCIARSFDPSLLDREGLVFGFLLHDVGKIGIPERILTKPGPLDPGEWEVMRRHPTLGARILDNVTFLQRDATDIVLYHHERWDGGGYPHRLAGEEIPVGARLFSVADTFDAMTSDRPYRKRMPIEVAIKEIDRCSASQFDPVVVDAFKRADREIRRRYQAAHFDRRAELLAP